MTTGLRSQKNYFPWVFSCDARWSILTSLTCQSLPLGINLVFCVKQLTLLLWSRRIVLPTAGKERLRLRCKVVRASMKCSLLMNLWGQARARTCSLIHHSDRRILVQVSPCRWWCHPVVLKLLLLNWTTGDNFHFILNFAFSTYRIEHFPPPILHHHGWCHLLTLISESAL